jgi:hypothetical protein
VSPFYIFVLGFVCGAFVSYVVFAAFDRAFDLREKFRRDRARGYWKKVNVRGNGHAD